MNEKILTEAQVITDYFNAIHTMLRRRTAMDIMDSGLTVQQVNLLRILTIKDGLTLKQISEQMGLAHSTVSGIVDRLEKKKVVQRCLDEKDKRFSHIFLGKQIQDYLKHIRPSQRANLLVGSLEQASEADRRLILDGMAALYRLLSLNFEEESAQDGNPEV